MEIIQIDGSQGEGGGQVLRTSLTLSLLTQKAVEVINIRAKRKKPGLLRQHLTCVRAAREICGGKVEGDELGSSRIVFTPAKVKAGNYHFAISTAGSTSLVCQTILLPLAFAQGQSSVLFEGGTHNGLSPSVTFLQWSFLPVLAQMGLNTRVSLERHGFNPAGGGKWRLDIDPVTALQPVKLMDNDEQIELANNLSATAIVSQLPESIAARELKTVAKTLGIEGLSEELVMADSAGPGNTLILRLQHNAYSSVFERVGEFGTSAEKVAKRTVGKLNKLLRSGATVEEHLADQLLLPMCLAGSGRYTTTEPSLHTRTNIQVINQITGIDIRLDRITADKWSISLRPTEIKLQYQSIRRTIVADNKCYFNLPDNLIGNSYSGVIRRLSKTFCTAPTVKG